MKVRLNCRKFRLLIEFPFNKLLPGNFRTMQVQPYFQYDKVN